jgi:hypothetical protein
MTAAFPTLGTSSLDKLYRTVVQALDELVNAVGLKAA